MVTQEFHKQRLFGIDFDVVTMRDAVDWVFRCAATGRQTHSRFVVTPNVSLTVRHQECEEFRRLISAADLTIVDGMPLVTMSRWFGKRLPERVAGSDLVFQLFKAAVEEMPLRIFLLGAAPGVADRAATRIHADWPAVEVVGTCSPEYGFENCSETNNRIVATINAAAPDVLIIGLGAPKQERWAFEHRHELQSAVTLCVGGTIDFLAGEQRRAPRWFRECGVEWIWRLATNPQRLLMRYVRDAIALPQLIGNELRGRCPVHASETDERLSPRPTKPAVIQEAVT